MDFRDRDEACRLNSNCCPLQLAGRMEKTVVVLAASSLSAASCGQTISFDLSFGKGKSAAANSRTVSKTLWTCCVEAITEYCRITFDLFPARYQLCVAAVDEAKCQPINSWRDEDQEIGKVRGQQWH